MATPVSVSRSLLALRKWIGYSVSNLRPFARLSKEPCAGKPHAGIREGAPGNGRLYLNRPKKMKNRKLIATLFTAILFCRFPSKADLSIDPGDYILMKIPSKTGAADDNRYWRDARKDRSTEGEAFPLF